MKVKATIQRGTRYLCTKIGEIVESPVPRVVLR